MELAGFFLVLALGGYSVSGAGPYTHTITAQTATSGALDQLPSTTLVQGIRGNTGTYFKYKGVCANDFKMSVKERGRFNMSASCIAADNPSVDSSFSVPGTRSSQTPMFGANITATWNSSAVTSQIREFDFTWNNALDKKDARGQIAAGTALQVLRFNKRKCEVSMKLWTDKSDTFFGDFTSDQIRTLSVVISGAGGSSLTFSFPRIYIDSFKDSFDGIRNVADLKLEAYTSTSTSNTPVSIALVNAIPAYLQ